MNPLDLPLPHPRRRRNCGQLSATGRNPNQETFTAPQATKHSAFSANLSVGESRSRKDLNASRGNNSRYQLQQQTALAAKLIRADAHKTGPRRCSFPGMSRIQPYPSMTVPQSQEPNHTEPTGPVITPNHAFMGKERQRCAASHVIFRAASKLLPEAAKPSVQPRHHFCEDTDFRTK